MRNPQNREMRFRWINWLSLVILWLGTFYVFFQSINLGTDTIVLVILLNILTFTTYYKPKTGAFLTLISLLFGLFGIIDFFHIKLFSNFQFFGWPARIDLIALALFTLHYFTNRQFIITFFKDFKEWSMPHLNDPSLKVDSYKKEFSEKNELELKSILKDDSLELAAIKAAEELLKEKNLNS